VLWIFIAIKNPSPWPGFEPATFGSSGQHTNHYTTKVTIKLYVNLKFQPPSPFVLMVFTKMVLLKPVLPLKICCHSPTVAWSKFRIHIRSLNVRHFGMAEDKGIELKRRGNLQWHDLRV
jgi:hypothetical protein